MILEKFLQFDEVFNETPLAIKEYLKDIPKKILIKTLLNLDRFYQNISFESHVNFLEYFFDKADLEYKTLILNKIKTLQSKNNYPIVITHTLSTLFLLEKALEINNNSENFDKVLCSRNLFKAILLVNEEIDKKQTIGIKSIPKEIEERYNTLPVLLIGSLPDYELINRDLRHIFFCQVYKAHLFFKFIESEPDFSLLYNKLLNKLGVEKREEIFRHLFQLSEFIFKVKAGEVTFRVPNDEKFIAITSFLDEFSNIKIGADYDFLHLRDSPIFKQSNDLYTIVQPTFLIEKIYKGWYFKLRDINDKEMGINKIKGLKDKLGLRFSENILLSNILSEAYTHKNKVIKYSGEEIKKEYPKILSEPDYYIRDWEKVFLFESKDTLLKKEVKTSYNFTDIELELNKKLFKGVTQLVGNINKILHSEVEWDKITNPSALTFYPVLILHEECFNTQGINFLVNQWFQKEKKMMLDSHNLNKAKIKPLTIITIDSLILIKELLEENKVRLHSLLDDYARKHLNKINKTYIPFVHFIHDKYPNLMPIPKKIKELGLGLAFNLNL